LDGLLTALQTEDFGIYWQSYFMRAFIGKLRFGAIFGRFSQQPIFAR
jgi:hypothetical protein